MTVKAIKVKTHLVVVTHWGLDAVTFKDTKAGLKKAKARAKVLKESGHKVYVGRYCDTPLMRAGTKAFIVEVTA